VTAPNYTSASGSCNASSNRSSENTPPSRRAPSRPPLRPHMLKIWRALWTFAARPGVQPTNNHAERALRSAVIYANSSSAANPKPANNASPPLLTAHTTCRFQRRSLNAYLTAF
jgi:Transposase IS66 family